MSGEISLHLIDGEEYLTLEDVYKWIDLMALYQFRITVHGDGSIENSSIEIKPIMVNGIALYSLRWLREMDYMNS